MVSDAPSGRDRYSAITDNRNKYYNFETVPLGQEVCIEHYYITVVVLAYFQSRMPCSGRNPQIAIFDSRRKSHIISEWYTMDTKHLLHTNRKPWSLSITGTTKTAYTVETVQDIQIILLNTNSKPWSLHRLVTFPVSDALAVGIHFLS